MSDSDGSAITCATKAGSSARIHEHGGERGDQVGILERGVRRGAPRPRLNRPARRVASECTACQRLERVAIVDGEEVQILVADIGDELHRCREAAVERRHGRASMPVKTKLAARPVQRQEPALDHVAASQPQR